MNFKHIPILIICRDRVSCLKQQVEAFEKRGYQNIIMVDNASTYEPLLEYYKQTPHQVIRMKENYGHTVLIDQGVVDMFAGDYYAYTDPDIIPAEECPDDFMEYFYNILRRHPELRKAGFSLKIDDLPDHFVNREMVIGWEKQYWERPLEYNVWLAPIDTTFALCTPGVTPIVWQWAGRTDKPYTARHTSWYIDSKNPSDEDTYYANHITTTTNWSQYINKETT